MLQCSDLLKKNIQCIKEGKKSKGIHIYSRKEEYLITVKLEESDYHGDSYPMALEKRMELGEYIENIGLWRNFQIGDIMALDDFERGRFVPSYFYEKADFKLDIPMMKVKPAGTYMVTTFSPWYEIKERFAEMKEKAFKMGYRMVGDIYCYDDVTSLLDSMDFLTSLEVKVEAI